MSWSVPNAQATRTLEGMPVAENKMAAPSSEVIDGKLLRCTIKLGFPLPALASMQEAGFNLRDACWDVKKSLSGFSLSFFWPAETRASIFKHTATSLTTKKRRRRRERKPDGVKSDIRWIIPIKNTWQVLASCLHAFTRNAMMSCQDQVLPESCQESLDSLASSYKKILQD